MKDGENVLGLSMHFFHFFEDVKISFLNEIKDVNWLPIMTLVMTNYFFLFEGL